MGAVIGLDIGGTNTRIGLVRKDVLERAQVVSSVELYHEGDEIEALGNLIRNFRQDEAIDAVSVAFPSSIGADGKTVLNAPNIIMKDGRHAFSGRNLEDPLSSLLGVKVAIKRDANCLLYFDAYRSGVKGIVVGCYIGTGYGASAMIHGKFLQGKNGCAMEAGHIPFFLNERQCNCGKAGCAETYASGIAAQKMLKAHYPDLTIDQVFRDHADDKPVAEIVEAIAVTVASLVNIFDPDTLFLGGGMMSEDFPKEKLVASIKGHALTPWPREGLDLRFTTHDPYVGVIGAALSVQEIGQFS